MPKICLSKPSPAAGRPSSPLRASLGHGLPSLSQAAVSLNGWSAPQASALSCSQPPPPVVRVPSSLSGSWPLLAVSLLTAAFATLPTFLRAHTNPDVPRRPLGREGRPPATEPCPARSVRSIPSYSAFLLSRVHISLFVPGAPSQPVLAPPCPWSLPPALRIALTPYFPRPIATLYTENSFLHSKPRIALVLALITARRSLYPSPTHSDSLRAPTALRPPSGPPGLRALSSHLPCPSLSQNP